MEMAINAIGEKDAQAADAPAPLQATGAAVPDAAPLSFQELLKRAIKMFLAGKGEPVASDDLAAVKWVTNELLIDVVDVISQLFSSKKAAVANSCGGLTELQARGYLLADLLGRFDLAYDDSADAAGRRAGTQAKAAKAQATLDAKAARKAAAVADRDRAAAKARADVFAAQYEVGLPGGPTVEMPPPAPVSATKKLAAPRPPPIVAPETASAPDEGSPATTGAPSPAKDDDYEDELADFERAVDESLAYAFSLGEGAAMQDMVRSMRTTAAAAKPNTRQARDEPPDPKDGLQYIRRRLLSRFEAQAAWAEAKLARQIAEMQSKLAEMQSKLAEAKIELARE